MSLVAWVVLVLAAFGVVGTPFMFGTPRRPYSPRVWIHALISAVLQVSLAGRVLGWW
jgi:hypothetical protein